LSERGRGPGRLHDHEARFAARRGCPEQSKRPGRAVPLLLIMGARNPQRHKNPPFRAGAHSWAKMLGYATKPTSAVSKQGVVTERYGPKGRELITFHLVDDMGHTWGGARQPAVELAPGPVDAEARRRRDHLEVLCEALAEGITG
jgi:poly(3-hydroxybutyrate) depolymerase